MYREEIYKQYPYLEKDIKEINFLKSVVWHEKVVLKYLPQNRDTKILELGCGSGSFLWLLREKGYTNVIGVDSSLAQITLRKELRLNIIQEDIFSFLKGVPEKSFQVIVAFDLLEHFHKDEVIDLLKLILEKLNEGSFFIFRVPNGESIFSGIFRYGDFTHETSYTRRSIRQIFTVVGFKKVECFPVKPVVHGIKSLIRAMLWNFIDKFLRFYLLVETGSSKDYILTQNLWGIAWK